MREAERSFAARASMGLKPAIAAIMVFFLLGSSSSNASAASIGNSTTTQPASASTQPVSDWTKLGPVAPGAVAASPLDSEEIHRTSDDTSNAKGMTATPSAPSNGSASSTTGTSESPAGLLRVTLALLGVLGLIVVMKILMRWLWPGAAAQRASRSVRVIARTPMSSRSALVLVQIGKRLVVVGDCGTQLSPICEITDPGEVAGMLGAIQTERLTSASRRFALKLGKAQGEFEEADEETDTHTSAERVRENFTGGEDIAAHDDDGDGRPEAASIDEKQAADPDGLVHTRQELHGLASRVRALAEQFRKPNP